MTLQELQQVVITKLSKHIVGHDISSKGVDGNVYIDHPKQAYEITVYIEETACPGRIAVHYGPGQVYKRYRIVTKFPNKTLASTKYTPIYYENGDNPKITGYSKITTLLISAINEHNKLLTQMQEEESAKRALKEKQEQRIKDKETRAKIYEALGLAITNIKEAKIESTYEDEYFNVELTNGLKVRLQAESNGVLITNVEVPTAYGLDQIQAVLSQLNGVK